MALTRMRRSQCIEGSRGSSAVGHHVPCNALYNAASPINRSAPGLARHGEERKLASADTVSAPPVHISARRSIANDIGDEPPLAFRKQFESNGI